MLLAELYKFLFGISYNFLPIIFNRPIDIIVINNNHIKVKGYSALFNKPLYVFTIDDVDVGICLQSCNAFFCCTNCHAVSQVFQMIPFLHFCRPSISCYSQRCNNQNFSDFKQVIYQIIDSRKGCYGFVNLSPCQGKELLSYVLQ